MIDICMALDQSVSPHTGVRTIQNTGVFLQAVFQPPRSYSLFLEHRYAAKTLISHPHNTASYSGYIGSGTRENTKEDEIVGGPGQPDLEIRCGSGRKGVESLLVPGALWLI